MSRLISRDPFARTELHSEVAVSRHNKTKGCAWCASHGRHYRYWTETDGGRRVGHDGTFCSVSCFRSYNDLPE